MSDKEKLILVDCDGVLLNWNYAFSTWIESHGYSKKVEDAGLHYYFEQIYDISAEEGMRYVRMFNESVSIGFLPPQRDAMQWVEHLHTDHGYRFHVISSMSRDPEVGRLRTKNLKKLFGESTFADFTYLDIHESKADALKQYEGSGLWWVEDLPKHAQNGIDLGLNGVLIEHGYNMGVPDIPKYKNWKELSLDIIDAKKRRERKEEA